MGCVILRYVLQISLFIKGLHLDFQLGETVDAAVNKLSHFYQRAYVGQEVRSRRQRNVFT